MRRIGIYCLVGLLVAGGAACGGGKTEEAKQAAETITALAPLRLAMAMLTAARFSRFPPLSRVMVQLRRSGSAAPTITSATSFT